MRTTGDTLSRWDKISHDFFKFRREFLLFLKVESENEHQQLSWHYLTHWNWVGERCLLVWMSRFLKKCQGSTLFDQYSITWCQVLLDRFDWFWHVWNLDLEPHWSQGWLRHVSNQFVLCELTFISTTCSWSTVKYISFHHKSKSQRWANGAWAEPDEQCVHLNYDAYRWTKSHQQRFCTCVWIKIQWKPKHFFINIGNLQGVGAAKLWREWWEIKFQLKSSKFFYC